ncbi:MAG: ABC transporter permease, partial [Planctomycetes bacterium]|nr:ABC transporter permease [Planctomycetota bacterium]
AVRNLGVEVGADIYVTFFDAETSHGVEKARTEKFRLADIAKFTERPGRVPRRGPPPPFADRPSVANDRDLTPYVPGVTDAESINDWDLPYNTAATRPDKEDDDYYKRYGLTPKAFIALAKGRELWGSRFGDTTTFRIPASNGVTKEVLQAKFLEQARVEDANFGFEFIPIKRDSLQASAGATPFDVLFLFLSFFIIAAALMLVALLFRLGIEQRANEVGILLATGIRRRKVGRILAIEGLIVAAIGGILGIVIGIAYAWLMIYGLNHWWSDAVVTSFLRFEIGGLSLAIGYASGVAICVLTILLTIRRTRKIAVRRLLAGQASSDGGLVYRRRPLVNVLVLFLLVGAIGLAGYATKLGGESQAGAFVGAGFVVLSALLIFIWYRLRQGSGSAALSGGSALAKLAVRNAGRNPWRSTISIGMVGFASFLIVAMSSFRLEPTENGVAGFDLIARSSRPVFHDLNTAEGRQKLLATDVDGDVLAGGNVLSFRLQPGQDASCNNLFKASQPQVLGVSQETIEYFDNPDVIPFSWATSAATTDKEEANPWQVLAGKTPAGHAVPVVIDKNTAMYSLQLYFGVGEEFEVEYDDDTKVKFRVAGLLSNSILQGRLLIGEADFERLFPHIDGYQFFLIRSPSGKQKEVVRALEKRLGDQGFDAESSTAELAGLLAVQNTYLETFQSLGALGLLLGTLGLATVQLRSVLERRQELALLRATGFQRSRLAKMVMLENSLLLFGGLLTGVISALLAVLPHMIFGDAAVPWTGLAIMLGAVLVVGFLSGFAAVRWTLKAPLLSALRGE